MPEPTPDDDPFLCDVQALLSDLPRDPWGRLKGERLRQLERIAYSMHSSLSPSDRGFILAELGNLRKGHLARLENWRRISGGH